MDDSRTDGGRYEDRRSLDPEGEPLDDPNGVHPEAVDRAFDWRGWILVAAIFVAFVIVPGLIYAYPRTPSTLGLSFWDTYLVLPMIPAVILGLLAVWATTRS